MTRRLLITGASGTLGRNVARAATAQGWDVWGTYHTNAPPLDGQCVQLDVSERGAVNAVLRQISPHAVVHTAFGLSEKAMWSTTAEGATFVAHAAQQVRARLIHISSDAIFDGTSNPYAEAARPNPRTLYGAAKAAAELAVGAIAPQAAIVRTSWIVSREPLDPRTQFMLDLAAGSGAGYLLNDQYRCPIGADDLADAIVELATTDFAGVIHIAGADAISRYHLGCAIARAYHLDPARLPAGPIPANLASTVVPDIRLDSTLARTLLKTHLRGIYEWLGTEP